MYIYIYYIYGGMSFSFFFWGWQHDESCGSSRHQPVAPVLASSASSARFDPCARSMRCRRWRQGTFELVNWISFLSLQQVDFTQKKYELGVGQGLSLSVKNSPFFVGTRLDPCQQTRWLKLLRNTSISGSFVCWTQVLVNTVISSVPKLGTVSVRFSEVELVAVFQGMNLISGCLPGFPTGCHPCTRNQSRDGSDHLWQYSKVLEWPPELQIWFPLWSSYKTVEITRMFYRPNMWKSEVDPKLACD